MTRIIAFALLGTSIYATWKIIEMFRDAKVSPDVPLPTWKEWLLAAALTLIPPCVAVGSLLYLVQNL